jgi:hypothetical protein
MIPNAVLAQAVLIVFKFALSRTKLSLNDEEQIGNVIPGLAHQPKFAIAMDTFFHRRPPG